MRKIKFRAKRIDNGDWVYGYYVYFELLDKHIIIADKIKKFVNGNQSVSDELEEIEVLPETIGQMWEYSKIKFYGGDLFYAIASESGSDYTRKMLCKVLDNNEGMGICVWHEGEWWHYGSMSFTSIDKIEGNIFDNPELLD